MTTSETYDRLIEDLSQGQLGPLAQQVLDALRNVYPKGLSRRQLVVMIYGHEPADINSDVNDRRIRKAIEFMRGLSIPIVSSSGEAGYRLDVSEVALAAMRAELCSRVARLNERIAAIDKTSQKVKQLGVSAIPSEIPASARASQPVLFERGW